MFHIIGARWNEYFSITNQICGSFSRHPGWQFICSFLVFLFRLSRNGCALRYFHLGAVERENQSNIDFLLRIKAANWKCLKGCETAHENSRKTGRLYEGASINCGYWLRLSVNFRRIGSGMCVCCAQGSKVDPLLIDTHAPQFSPSYASRLRYTHDRGDKHFPQLVKIKQTKIRHLTFPNGANSRCEHSAHSFPLNLAKTCVR